MYMGSNSTILTSEGKRGRFDAGGVGAFPERTGSTTGDVTNPRVDVQFLVPPLEDAPTWTYQIGKSALIFNYTNPDDSERKQQYNSRFAHPNEDYTTVLDVMHVNALIAKWFIAHVNDL